MHRPNCTESKRDARDERPESLEKGATSVLCVNHDLRACVRAEPRNKVGQGDKLARRLITAAEGRTSGICAPREPSAGRACAR